MKTDITGQIFYVDSKKPYKTDELYKLILEQGNWGEAKPQLKKSWGFTNIVFPGMGGFENLVSASKTKISIMQQKASGGGILKSLALDAVTDGFGSLLNMEGGSNADIMKAIAAEIERIVG